MAQPTAAGLPVLDNEVIWLQNVAAADAAGLVPVATPSGRYAGG